MSPSLQTPATRERRIDYVEFASADLEASRAFFERVFGWQFQAYGPDYLAFNDGRMDGGFYRIAVLPQGEGAPLVVLHAEQLAPMVEHVEAAGGVIVAPVFGFPGGSRFHFREPGGSILAVWSERPVDAPGA
ncbi:VOC family protein [Xanthomonas maliensis]|uniref:VOC family protein n=1 Tax=Xanthomonas maliensis TaxID=1321368 RepID=UPI0003B30763|nr:VOC family protein [Xanthomonas maliensis]